MVGALVAAATKLGVPYTLKVFAGVQGEAVVVAIKDVAPLLQSIAKRED